MGSFHLIQSKDIYGSLDRAMELSFVQRMNQEFFGDDLTTFEGRPTFAQIMALCKRDRVNVIANGDIYFDADSALQEPKEGEAFALSRWDLQRDGTLIHHNSIFSQDAWLFRGIPPPIDAPYPMGRPGCDNAFAAAMMKAGLRVVNPSLTIKAKHVHFSEYRTYDKRDHASHIPPPYAFPPPVE